MKKTCVIFALFILLSLPYSVSARDLTDGSLVKVIGIDGTVQQGRTEVNNHSIVPSDITNSVQSTVLSNSTINKENGVDPIKAMQTSVENALYGVMYGVADEFVKGSFTILGTEANITEGADGRSRTINYSIHMRDIEPFGPPYVVKTLLISGGFYLGIIFLIIIGSRLILIFSINMPEEYDRYRMVLTGEYKPYTRNTARFACYAAMSDPVISFFIIILITLIHNIFISGLSADSIGLMNEASDSLPTWVLTGISLYATAFQTVIGEFGIWIIVSLVFVRGIISNLLLMVGAIKLSAYLNVVVWGTFLLFNLMDVINVLAFSAGLASSVYTGFSIFVLIGTLAGGFINLFILAIIAIFALCVIKNSMRV